MNVRFVLKILSTLGLVGVMVACEYVPEANPEPYFCTQVMVGEISQTRAIVQARLTTRDTLLAYELADNGDIVGKRGGMRVEYSERENFTPSFFTAWKRNDARSDYLVKQALQCLKPGRRYFYRIHFGGNEAQAYSSEVGTFRTLLPINDPEPVSFVVYSGSHVERFYLGMTSPEGENTSPYEGADRFEGFPAFELMQNLSPDFIVANGNNVHYDEPVYRKAENIDELRRKWHTLLSMPRLRALNLAFPFYWLKNDQDFRFQYADTLALQASDRLLPSAWAGKQVFAEQLPLTTEEDVNYRPYRTYQINEHVQIWLLEAREFRSPNSLEDGPQKSMWGEEQLAWLKTSLKRSEATFKFLISPTPVIGPDFLKKKDNHSNLGGFRYEGEQFLTWLRRNGFKRKNLYFIVGDQAWQYHTIHPMGFEEFGCGALISQYATLGPKPGEAGSTDPEGLLGLEYSSDSLQGGFLHTHVAESLSSDSVLLTVSFFAEGGDKLYELTRTTLP